MDKVKLSEWVKEARLRANLTQEQLAEKLNLAGKASISAMEQGRSQPSYEQILMITKICKVPFPHENPEEVDFPRSPSTEDFIVIPQYTAKGECGTGELNEHVELRSGLSFKRSWLNFMGLKPKNLEVIYAKGDSMLPTIAGGATVLIDTSKMEPSEGSVYAIIRDGNGLVIKRLFRVSQGWTYRSDNTNKAQFPDLEPLANDIIVGQVVWQGGTNGL